jgi:branched-chain amino acid transport system ATP-binding protein
MRVALDGVTVRFGAVAALNQVSLEVASGERRALIGPNGAGKSTLFGVVGGGVRPASGRVLLNGDDATRMPGWRRARLGIARTFQRSTLFRGLNVADNLAQAVRARRRSGWRFWPGERPVIEEVRDRLERAGLLSVAGRPAGELGHGEQRALEIELALAAEPRALLLDEPMAGLSRSERASMVDRLKALPPEVTLLIVEHDLDAVFALAERITVLDHGVVIADGVPDQVRGNPRVQEVYLGG